MPANKIKLEICGSNYVIATTDTEEYVLFLAEKLDSDMTQMLAQQSHGFRHDGGRHHRAGLSGRAEKEHQRCGQHARAEQGLPGGRPAKAKLAAEEARREVERLRREIGYLKEKK